MTFTYLVAGVIVNRKGAIMVHVIASVKVKLGKGGEFIEIFKANVPLVKAEKGCIQYVPTVDIDTKLPPQIMDENVVTIIEAWESLEALRNHLVAPHMLAYREKVSGFVENVSLKVLQEA
jgi:quinol monooxygenase YgiN